MQSCWHPFLGRKPILLKAVCKKKGQEMADLPYFSDEGVSCAAHTVMSHAGKLGHTSPSTELPGLPEAAPFSEVSRERQSGGAWMTFRRKMPSLRYSTKLRGDRVTFP